MIQKKIALPAGEEKRVSGDGKAIFLLLLTVPPVYRGTVASEQ